MCFGGCLRCAVVCLPGSLAFAVLAHTLPSPPSMPRSTILCGVHTWGPLCNHLCITCGMIACFLCTQALLCPAGAPSSPTAHASPALQKLCDYLGPFGGTYAFFPSLSHAHRPRGTLKPSTLTLRSPASLGVPSANCPPPPHTPTPQLLNHGGL